MAKLRSQFAANIGKQARQGLWERKQGFGNLYCKTHTNETCLGVFPSQRAGQKNIITVKKRFSFQASGSYCVQTGQVFTTDWPWSSITKFLLGQGFHQCKAGRAAPYTTLNKWVVMVVAGCSVSRSSLFSNISLSTFHSSLCLPRATFTSWIRESAIRHLLHPRQCKSVLVV